MPKIKIQHVDDKDRLVEIEISDGLTGEQKSRLSSAMAFIQARLREPNSLGITKDEAKRVASLAAFATTSDSAIGLGYSSSSLRRPLIVFTDQTDLWHNEVELSVTLLHELSHLSSSLAGGQATEPGGPATSREEAEHDLACYDALGLPMPLRDWMLKYPELLKGPRSHI